MDAMARVRNVDLVELHPPFPIAPPKSPHRHPRPRPPIPRCGPLSAAYPPPAGPPGPKEVATAPTWDRHPELSDGSGNVSAVAAAACYPKQGCSLPAYVPRRHEGPAVDSRKPIDQRYRSGSLAAGTTYGRPFAQPRRVGTAIR